MTIELSPTDRRILVAALTLYRINRGAQGKLDSQRIRRTDLAESDRIQERYDALVSATERLTQRLQVES